MEHAHKMGTHELVLEDIRCGLPDIARHVVGCPSTQKTSVDDVAGNDPGRRCSPRHQMPFTLETRVQTAFVDVASNICRDEGSQCV